MKTVTLILATVGILLTECKNTTENDTSTTFSSKKSYTEEEQYRPHFHFTPQKNWMNDPNGMFYYKGYYHLFFQYYPEATVWGPMHWGHAISEDMITWSEQPIAIYPDEKGYIFSGSAVVDIHNTSGFGNKDNPPIIAIFTYHDPEGEKKGAIDYQSQAIAYSLDEGMTWTKYDGNPVIENPGIKDFRDPKVIWDTVNKQWVLALATIEETRFYRSKNLKNWEYMSSFGKGIGAHQGVWECPDLFPMPVADTDEVKWVLLQSLNPGGVNGGSGTQYFIGDFDGKNFHIDPSFKNDLNTTPAFWIDYGRDNYAGVTWSNIPENDGRILYIGWMSNWNYAQQVPTKTWRSTMTIAREFKLIKTTTHSYRLLSQPVDELKKYISKSVEKGRITVNGETVLFENQNIDLSRAIIQFKLTPIKENIYTFSLYNKKGDRIDFGLNNIEKFFFTERSNSGKVSFSEEFTSKMAKAPVENSLSKLDVQLIIDKTSIEIFYNNGEVVMTEIFFPNTPMEVFAIKADDTTVEDLVIQQLEFK